MKSLTFWFDYLIGYMLTHPSKLPYYHRMMYEKYGNLEGCVNMYPIR